jgi:uncharacterized cupin superfamily protein
MFFIGEILQNGRSVAKQYGLSSIHVFENNSSNRLKYNKGQKTWTQSGPIYLATNHTIGSLTQINSP